MGYPEFSAIKRCMNHFLNYFDLAKGHAKELSCTLVVVSGYVDYFCTFTCFTQEFLYYVIVGLGPVE